MDIFIGLFITVMTVITFSSVFDAINDEEYGTALFVTVSWICLFIACCFFIAK